MEKTKILTITGTNSSGKTTLAFKIAKELENNNSEVCIVSFDTLCPLSTIKDNYDNYNVSIGYMLTKDTNATQRDLYTAMIPITNKISILSYIYGDTKDRYPKILGNRVRDLIEILSGMVDYIIIDAGSNIIRMENRASCQMANRILNVLEPNYKSIAYSKTYKLMLDRIDIDESKIITLMNKIDYDTNYKEYILNMGIKYYSELPYLSEIQKNVNNPMKKLEGRTHETEKYIRNFKIIMKRLYNIDYEENLYRSRMKIEEQKEEEIESKIGNENERKIKNLSIEKKEEKEKKEKKKHLFEFLNKKEKQKENKKENNLFISGRGEF